ncbi:MAG: FGGY-family carbohydrate kinase [Candidatus Vecturithrix sp.]|nr:FGGY-family carbohydrate kinase [Candidatus Vecturithrix sp.]
MAYLVGIDLGSSSLKAAVFQEDGTVIAKQSAANALHTPRPGWSEYDPQEVWERIVGCLQTCLASVGDCSAIRGVSISSMGEVGIPIARSGKPLTPAISWMDQRALPQLNWWAANFDRAYLLSISGMPLDPMYSIHKIMWLRDYQPDIYASMYKWICLPDYIVFKLTGELISSYSHASRTMVFDVHTKTWSSDLCEAAEISTDIFPSVANSGVIAGEILPDIATLTGLPAGTPVVLGGHDHACVAVALGLTRADEVVDSTGTGEGLAAVTASSHLPASLAKTNRYACYPHCVPEQYLVLGHLGVIGQTLTWITDVTGHRLEEYFLSSEAKRPLYFPFLGNPDDPLQDAGAWMGIMPSLSGADLVSSLMESVCFWFRCNLEHYTSGYDVTLRRIWLTGGLSQCEVLSRLKANVLNAGLTIPHYTDLAVLGAAIVAGVGAGVYASWDEAFARVRLPHEQIVPNDAHTAFYQAQYAQYVHVGRAVTFYPLSPPQAGEGDPFPPACGGIKGGVRRSCLSQQHGEEAA